MIMKSRRKTILTLLFTLLMLPTVLAEVYTPPPALPSDTSPIEKPEFRGQEDDFADAIDMEFIMSLRNTLDISRQIRRLKGTPKQAKNVNAWGEVENSSWFTNRNHLQPMSLEEIARGSCTGDGPETSGVWIIKRAKAEGVTAGFHIEDSRGERYVIKFDLIGYGGLNRTEVDPISWTDCLRF